MFTKLLSTKFPLRRDAREKKKNINTGDIILAGHPIQYIRSV